VVYPSSLYLDTSRIWVCVWVDLLSPVVMSCDTCLPSFMMLSLACGLVLRVLVFHPLRYELTMVVVRCYGLSKVWFGGDGLSPSGDVVSLARISYGPVLRRRPSRTTGAATCAVWNDFLTN
jgi:hypothetical protein